MMLDESYNIERVVNERGKRIQIERKEQYTLVNKETDIPLMLALALV